MRTAFAIQRPLFLMTILTTRFPCLALTALVSLCGLALLGCQKKTSSSANPSPDRKKDTHESLAAEATALAREFSDTLASAKDTAGAKAAALKLDDIVTRFEQLAGRMESIGDPEGELKKKVVLMFNEHETIIAKELPEVIKTILGNREIGEILEQAMEDVRERMGRLTVLDRWKASPLPDPEPELEPAGTLP
ncbi:MAG: hypothetical protein MK183_11820 [Verrucomicrobiales bacterium]|nr:hypothetical protein [Verrucomicrobiales bacterium]MED5586608.1 hypothetical protein [Verrucomicrobiota bacterium]